MHFRCGVKESTRGCATQKASQKGAAQTKAVGRKTILVMSKTLPNMPLQPTSGTDVVPTFSSTQTELLIGARG